jgi:signal transduction histidine kinase
MTRIWRRLDVRLFASYALVALVVSGVLLITLSLVAPRRFDDEYRTATGASAEGTNEESEGEVQSLFVDSLRSSLPVALVVSIGAAGVVSVFVARRILRPVRHVRDATHRIAAGRYDEPVVEPTELELAELARDVNHLGVALQLTERRRARLISEVAHEIRTPLTAIEGYVEGLLDGVFEPTEEVLTTVAEEAARLRRLASDLSELSRAEEGALALRVLRLDVGVLVLACADRLRPQYDDKHVGLEIRTSAPLLVDGDADRITQVLTNLLGNALTYTPSGGRVIVTTRRNDRVAEVWVADTGIGLAAEDVPLVFDRFYRVAGPVRPPGGSGIGLTIARGIARAHGGEVSASSPGPGHGSTFRLALPLADSGPGHA